MRHNFLIIVIIILCFSCKQKHELPDPFQAGWQGEKVCEVIEENEKIRILKCNFSPNVGHEKHYHDPHFGYTLQGGVFKIEDSEGVREANIPNGYSWHKDSVTVHQVQNIGNTTATFLIIEYK